MDKSEAAANLVFATVSTSCSRDLASLHIAGGDPVGHPAPVQSGEGNMARTPLAGAVEAAVAATAAEERRTTRKRFVQEAGAAALGLAAFGRLAAPARRARRRPRSSSSARGSPA